MSYSDGKWYDRRYNSLTLIILHKYSDLCNTLILFFQLSLIICTNNILLPNHPGNNKDKAEITVKSASKTIINYTLTVSLNSKDSIERADQIMKQFDEGAFPYVIKKIQLEGLVTLNFFYY